MYTYPCKYIWAVCCLSMSFLMTLLIIDKHFMTLVSSLVYFRRSLRRAVCCLSVSLLVTFLVIDEGFMLYFRRSLRRAVCCPSVSSACSPCRACWISLEARSRRTASWSRGTRSMGRPGSGSRATSRPRPQSYKLCLRGGKHTMKGQCKHMEILIPRCIILWWLFGLSCK